MEYFRRLRDIWKTRQNKAECKCSNKALTLYYKHYECCTKCGYKWFKCGGCGDKLAYSVLGVRECKSCGLLINTITSEKTYLKRPTTDHLQTNFGSF